jgi:hypothetical protein
MRFCASEAQFAVYLLDFLMFRTDASKSNERDLSNYTVSLKLTVFQTVK